MSAVDSSAAPSKPAEGGRCPRCNNGVLYRIAETVDGVLLHCFNCDTSGSIAHEGDYSHVVEADAGTGVTGFQLTSDQLAAKQELGIDPHKPEPWATAAPAEAGEPAETHDVVPPDEREPEQQ